MATTLKRLRQICPLTILIEILHPRTCVKIFFMRYHKLNDSRSRNHAIESAKLCCYIFKNVSRLTLSFSIYHFYFFDDEINKFVHLWTDFYVFYIHVSRLKLSGRPILSVYYFLGSSLRKQTNPNPRNMPHSFVDIRLQ